MLKELIGVTTKLETFIGNVGPKLEALGFNSLKRMHFTVNTYV